MLSIRPRVLLVITLPLLATIAAFAAEPSHQKIDPASFWSFQRVERPALPGVPGAPGAPQVKHADWPLNEIDRFILAKLEDAGLDPSPVADRRTLIRRLYLDLNGVPPTPAEVDAFVADTAADAYERVVDRLLASPRFGEHWARVWLDLARYADTQGYEKDNHRDIWRWRDWLIDALNADKPFDRFTLEVIAGDLLADADDDTRLATALHRNTMTNTEGGTDDEEFRVAAVKDRVDTTMNVWMGLTMGCAQCHSHKYDPITIGEYYSFYAIFNQTEDHDQPGDQPRIPTPTPEQQRKIAELRRQIAALDAERTAVTPAFVEHRRAWERTIADAAPPWTPVIPTAATSANGSTLTVQPDGSVLASGQTPATDTYTLVATVKPTDLPGAITAIRVEALTDPSLPRTGPGRNGEDPNFVINELTLTAEPIAAPGADAEAKPTPIALTRARADFSQNGWPVAGAIDGNESTGWAISQQFEKPHVAVFDLAKPLTVDAGKPIKLTATIRQLYGHGLVLGRVRLSLSAADPKSLEPTFDDGAASLARIAEADRTPQQAAALDEAFRATYEPTAKLGKQIAELTGQIEATRKGAPTTPIMRDLPADRRRATHVHLRGNFLDKGDAVQPGVPAAFGSLPSDAPADRLAVARWLVSRDNPLTARVTVNRIWARLFGIGIVETEEDFGTQGTPPSHRELLDWLAASFMEDDAWSRKKLMRRIVMSATYRQSSVVDAHHAEVDPRNRLLGRAPRFRLPAEVVRDQALAAAGLLSGKIGGPSVMPPQPDGVWKTIYNGANWKTPEGEDRYRRGVYTYMRRTSPYPSALTFDAGSREVCLIRRIRTNTPLQAMVTLNDPVFVEAAAALARRMVSETDGDAAARIAHGFTLLLARPPADAERDRLVALYESTRTDFRADAEATRAMLANAPPGSPPIAGVEPADLAAYTVVANVMLNLDQTLNRD